MKRFLLLALLILVMGPSCTCSYQEVSFNPLGVDSGGGMFGERDGSTRKAWRELTGDKSWGEEGVERGFD